MYKDNKISVIIPCYNEEATIGGILKKMPSFVDELIVVDNNSNDKTAKIAVKNGAKVVKEYKQGVGWATKRGLSEAKGMIILVMDGDGQHDPKDIIRFVRKLLSGKFDIVSGNRFHNNGFRSKTGIFFRDAGNCFQTWIFNMLLGTKIGDSQNGMWVFRKEVLEKINLKSAGFNIVEEFKARCIHKDFKFAEIAMDCNKRKDKSRLSPLRDGAKNIFFLFVLFYEIKIKKVR